MVFPVIAAAAESVDLPDRPLLAALLGAPFDPEVLSCPAWMLEQTSPWREPAFTLAAKLELPSSDNTYFGAAVSINGDTAVVGTPAERPIIAGLPKSDGGAAYVFQRSSSDPGQWSFRKKLIPPDGAPLDRFGQSVSISGDWVAVGAPYHDLGTSLDQGAVYVFARQAGGPNQWGLVRTLTAIDGATNDHFGMSVSLSGDRLVVGAPDHQEGRSGLIIDQGAAYLFERHYGGPNYWGLRRKLTAYDGKHGASFGYAVSVSGDVVVVGAPGLGGIQGMLARGAAYVFERDAGAVNFWGLAKKLVASDGGRNDMFGQSVSASAALVVVGAPYQKGAAYLFQQEQTGTNRWREIKKLTASDGRDQDHFGYAVSVSQHLVAVGAAWAHVGGAVDQGVAYVFRRDAGGAGGWGETKRLVARDGGPGDGFGCAVSASDDMVLIGAAEDDVERNVDQGSAYLFIQDAVTADAWIEAPPWRAPDAVREGAGDGDLFGNSVGMSGETIVVGAPRRAVKENAQQGAAYVFARDASRPLGWRLVQQLTTGAGAAGDFAGYSVAVSEDVIVLGAPRRAVGIQTNQGAAYVFERNTGGAGAWGEVAELTASDGATDDQFGYAVAISGPIIVVSAPLRDVGANTNQGAVYFFERTTVGNAPWQQTRILTASNGSPRAQLGYALSLRGSLLVVGAPYHDDGAYAGAGAAYLFERDNGGPGNWGLSQQLRQDPERNAYFGSSVAVSENFVVLGSPGHRSGSDWALNAAGVAGVFERNPEAPGTWRFARFLRDYRAALGDRFGTAVAVSGDMVLVGAPWDDMSSGGDEGSFHLFQETAWLPDWPDPTWWGQVKRVTTTRLMYSGGFDYLGSAFAMSGTTVVTGAPGSAIGPGGSHGSVYVCEFPTVRLGLPALVNGRLQFTVSGPAGLECIIERTSNLDEWTSVTTTILLNQPVPIILDAPERTQRGFYRAVIRGLVGPAR